MNIHFAGDMPVAAVEVLSPTLETVARLAVSPGSVHKVDVPSEASFIRLHLPSGQIVTMRHPGNLDYEINRADLEEKLGRRQEIGSSGPQTVRQVKRYHQSRSGAKSLSPKMTMASLPLDVFGAEPKPASVPNEPDQLTSGVVVEWKPPLAGHLSLDGLEVAFEPPDRELPYTLRVTVGSTTLALALPGDLETAYVRETAVGEAGRIVSVRVSTRVPTADTVGGYLSRGDYFAAQTMAGWADEGARMLKEKEGNPYAATVGAYLLLRLERYDLMRDWARNLANWFPFLPDGCVIWAWQSIRERKNYDEAADYFLKAARRGLPLHTQGLRLLSEGLRGVGPWGEDALKELTRTARLVLWNSPFTACIEGTPEPGSTPITWDVDYMPVA
jgi:hypothetical protein